MQIPCLLCKSKETRTVSSLTRLEIVKLWKLLDRPVEEADLCRCRLPENVDLLECDACGFQFFDPAQAGDGEFYQKLAVQDGVYYNASRPEFEDAISHAKKKGYQSVLDLGCGSGNFLDLARDSGLSTTGMELNEQAASAASAKGHDILPGILTKEFLAHHTRKYDMVTLFQVVEHLSDPIGLLEMAKQLVNDGGTLMFSVPNRRGLYQLYPLDPHQWPPHHISRWRTTDFKRVAETIGMIHLKSSGDPLHGRSLVDSHARNNQARIALGKRLLPGASTVITGLSVFYRFTGMKHVIRNMGLSIHCYMEQTTERP